MTAKHTPATPLPIDDERQLVGSVYYYRVPTMDKRFSRGDDFSGDAWVRYTAVGHRPDDCTHAANAYPKLVEALREAVANGLHGPIEHNWRVLLRELGEE